MERLRRVYTEFIQRRREGFNRFIDKRIPIANTHILKQKNLFIFPTKQGAIYFAVMIVLWVLGTNYQNNLILALAFFMVSLFILSILMTFHNLNQLEIQYSGAQEAFAGDDLRLKFHAVNRKSKWIEGVEFAWKGREAESVTENYKSDSEHSFYVPYFVERRGRVVLPRMRVQSVFPFGIVRCWTWLKWDADALVYPSPKNGRLGESNHTGDDSDDGLHPTKGGEDFSGLKEYAPGDPLRRISWKVLAKGRGVYVKEFSENISKEKWLDLSSVQGRTLEEKVSVLAFWILHYYQENEHFGLSLPSSEISPSAGHQHRTRCLELLAEI